MLRGWIAESEFAVAVEERGCFFEGCFVDEEEVEVDVAWPFLALVRVFELDWTIAVVDVVSVWNGHGVFRFDIDFRVGDETQTIYLVAHLEGKIAETEW